jgi:hypothetical protein
MSEIEDEIMEGKAGDATAMVASAYAQAGNWNDAQYLFTL